MGYARDWEEAAEISPKKKAVAKFGVVRHNGKDIEAEIIMEKCGEGYLVYKNTQRRIRTATTREIDGTSNWRPW